MERQNPHDLSRVAGGSSGGSARGGGDGRLSGRSGFGHRRFIRQPAAFCGASRAESVVWFRFRSGLIAMASSFDQIGPMAKTVEDAEIIFNAIKGQDILIQLPLIWTTLKIKIKTRKKLRIGLLKYDKSGVDKEINESMENSAEKIFKNLGYEVSEIELPNIKYSVPCYYILAPAEVSSNLARFDGVRVMAFLKRGENLTEDYMKTREAGFGLKQEEE